MKPTLSIIGAGKLGQTLGKLWFDRDCATINQVINQSLKSSLAAIQFIGAGKAGDSVSHLKPCNYLLIATPDAQISRTAKELAALPYPWHETTVFHCSGALSSEVLEPLHVLGAKTASVHPIHSFAEPKNSIKQLAGSFCCAEGAVSALNTLKPLFEAIEMQWQLIDADKKTLYHASFVIACNFLPALVDSALQCLAKANIDENIAKEMIQPLMQGTLANIFRTSANQALTGPIARGDLETVARQLTAIEKQLPKLRSLYSNLSLSTLDVAKHEQQRPDLFIEFENLLKHDQ